MTSETNAVLSQKARYYHRLLLEHAALKVEINIHLPGGATGFGKVTTITGEVVVLVEETRGQTGMLYHEHHVHFQDIVGVTIRR